MHSEPAEPAPFSLWRGLLLCALVLPLVGCGKAASRSKTKGQERLTSSTVAEDVLESATEALYKSTDLTSCKAAVQQLNTYLGRHTDARPQPLSAETQARVEHDFAVDRDELAEINSTTFTALDAHYLEACFLLRDAARGLQVGGAPPLEQAQAAFAWVNRQVRLDEKPIPPVPEIYALRRGRGSEDERARVFVALLQQLGLDACLVRVPHESDVSSVRVWPAVVVDKAIHVFDARLGLPLPGPQGQGVATLGQLRKEPALVSQLTVDPKSPYDIKPEQLKNADIVWYCPLPSLAPRMTMLERQLQEKNKVRLTVDHTAALARVRAAAADGGVPVVTTDASGRALLPARFLRYFLPTTDGGIDQPRPYPIQALEGFAPADAGQVPAVPLTQLQFFQLELGPWKSLPESLRVLRWQTPQGIQIRLGFAEQFSRFFLDPQGPRDLILRGHLEEAMRALTAERDQSDQIMLEARKQPHLDTEITNWGAALNVAYDQMARAQRDAQLNKEGAGDALQEARERVDAVAKAGQQKLTLVMLKGLAPAKELEIDFARALAKHEQAERLEASLKRPGAAADAAQSQAAREAWKAAASWWVTFEQRYDGSPAIVQARRLHARAAEAEGDKATAIGLLENFSGPISDAEKTAHLYRASRLKR